MYNCVCVGMYASNPINSTNTKSKLLKYFACQSKAATYLIVISVC